MSYICIGAPYWLGELQGISAVEAIKQSGIAGEINANWVDIEPDYDAYLDPVVAVNIALAEAIQAHSDKTPLIFAGDCVFSLGAMKGLEPHHPAIIWYDAHGDFNTPETSPSGFLGGMPLAALVGRGNEALMDAVGLAPIAEEDVLITDARDLDPEEGENLKSSGLQHFEDVAGLLSAVLPQKPLYIHFDTDVVRLEEMPPMNYPAQGGPTMEQTLDTLERVTREGDVVGILFSLWNQELDGAQTALESTLKAVRTFVASRSDNYDITK